MKLAVRPYIKNNFIINPDTTICYNQSPGIILADPAYDGDGLFKYTWLVSNNNHDWTITSGIDTLDYYKTGFLIDTSYFRRKISSGVCTDSGKIIKVAVLPLIGENIIGPIFQFAKVLSPIH